MFLLTLTVPHDMMSWAYRQREGIDLSATWSLSTISYFLPSEIFYCFVYDTLHNVSAFSATIAMLIVALAVMMIDGKGTNSVWRTKVLQATGIAGVLVCAELAYSYSFWVHYQQMSPMAILVPVVLLVIPLLILKKTRQPKATNVTKTE